MEKEIAEALAALGGDNGWLVQVMAWMASVRVVLKLISSKLQKLAENAIARITDTDSDDDDALANRVLSSKAWRMIAFLLDMIASVKLPLTLPKK